jgi:glycosyltransferase involved in cell wall biosynthesis
MEPAMTPDAETTNTASERLKIAPAVSVLVPTHHRPEPLRRAVEAIVSQEYSGPLEIIVVFDKSDPEPVDVELPAGRTISYLTNDRTPGLAGARNTGIMAATGELIAFCDDDDMWLPGKLAKQVALLVHHPELLVVGCHITLSGADGQITRPGQANSVSLSDLLVSRVSELHSSTVLARRQGVLDLIGLVDEQIPGGYYEDYDWLLRAAKQVPIRLVDEPLVSVTWVTGSQFTARWQMISDAVRYLLDKHPEFAASKPGTARLEGQVAFAEAAQGRRREAGRWARRAIRHDPLERRAYLALAVSARLLTANTILALAHRRGRGI